METCVTKKAPDGEAAAVTGEPPSWGLAKGVLRCVQTGQWWPSVICEQFNGICQIWAGHTPHSRARRCSEAAAVETLRENVAEAAVAGGWGIDGEGRDPWNVLQILSWLTTVLCIYIHVYTQMHMHVIYSRWKIRLAFLKTSCFPNLCFQYRFLEMWLCLKMLICFKKGFSVHLRALIDFARN